jgi:predicted O-methyltransferase YrrM
MDSRIASIKEHFLNCFEELNYEWLHKEQKIQHPIHNGKQIVTYAVLHNLVKFLKPKKILEIGTWEYHSANVMALASDSVQRIDTFDIRSGGYNGNTNAVKRSNKIDNYVWRPFHTSYDCWKYENSDLKDFIYMSNGQIFEFNLAQLKSVCGFYSDPPEDKYDFIFIDGDHSYKGLEFDLSLVHHVASKNAIIVIDNILDERLSDVNKMWQNIVETNKYLTYDFSDWNQKEKDRIIEMGIIII